MGRGWYPLPPSRSDPRKGGYLPHPALPPPPPGPGKGYPVADPGGGPRGPWPPPSVPDKDYLLCTSWHFLVKKSYIMNFRAPFSYFFQKISSLASLGMNNILLSHSSGLSLLIISFIFHLVMCILLHYNDSSHNLSCL